MRDSLEDKSMLFTHFYLCQEKKQNPGLYLQQGGSKLLNMFFPIKLAVLVSWRTTPVSFVLIF